MHSSDFSVLNRRITAADMALEAGQLWRVWLDVPPPLAYRRIVARRFPWDYNLHEETLEQYQKLFKHYSLLNAHFVISQDENCTVSDVADCVIQLSKYLIAGENHRWFCHKYIRRTAVNKELPSC